VNEFLRFCPKCGNRVRGSLCGDCGHDSALSDKEKADIAKLTKKKLIWTLSLLGLLPPIGILLTWVLQKDWNQNVKIIASSVSAAWFIFVIVIVVTTEMGAFIPMFMGIGIMYVFISTIDTPNPNDKENK
jgi:uncharacterized membrane protein YvbJ